MRIIKLLCLLIPVGLGCQENHTVDNQSFTKDEIPQGIFLEVLGTAQDAGYPQANCEKECCQAVWEDPTLSGKVVCLGVLDPGSRKRFLFDATPDFPQQLQTSKNSLPESELAGVFLTHAHMGHYTGLMYLGHEAMGAKNVPVYVMPRMQEYLSTHGPWSQLVNYENISLRPLANDSLVGISDSLFVKPLLVPHRDEYSETVGYLIYGPRKIAFFLPDIDKWAKWERDILELIQEVDYAFLDASFFANGEIQGRDMSQIPHPFVAESMELFQGLSAEDKAKVYFIHFNHTNPLLRPDSPESQRVLQAGYHIAREGLRLGL